MGVGVLVSGAVPLPFASPVVLALRAGVFVHDPAFLRRPSGLLSARCVDAIGGVKDPQTLVAPLIT